MRKTGGCMCGAVRYQCDMVGDAVLVCHCEQCRRQSGHVWAAARARGDSLEIDGDDALLWFRGRRSERGFCGRCGSSLFWRVDGDPDVSIGVGTLDDTEGLAIVADVFLAEKSAYSVATPGVECYLRDRDEAPISDG